MLQVRGTMTSLTCMFEYLVPAGGTVLGSCGNFRGRPSQGTNSLEGESWGV